MPPRRRITSKKISSINASSKKAPQADAFSKNENDKNLRDCPKKASVDNKESNANDSQLKLEIFWCVQEIESLRSSKKLSPKQDDDLLKTINCLLNKKTPLIKKRQLMRQSCGDYKEKMASQLELIKKRKPKFTKKCSFPQNSQFLKKSANKKESVDSISNNLETLSVSEDPDVNSAKLSDLFRSKENSSFSFNFPLEK